MSKSYTAFVLLLWVIAISLNTLAFFLGIGNPEKSLFWVNGIAALICVFPLVRYVNKFRDWNLTHPDKKD